MIPVIIRPLARDDLDQITEYYLAKAGPEVASGFLTAWTKVLRHLSQFPQSGSPRFAEIARNPGLRSWLVRGFPYLAFYRLAGDQLVVLRVLHSSRDIPASLRLSDEE